MTKYVDEEVFSDFQASVFVIILAVLVLIVYFSYDYLEEEVNKTECIGVYDTFDCRVNKQIRLDAEDQISILKKQVDAIKTTQREVVSK